MISIIIPTLNEEINIQRLIMHLRNNSSKKEQIEITVVNSQIILS